MKTFRNIALSALFLLIFIWIVTQNNTSDAGKLIRLGSYITSAILWFKYTTWGKRIMNSKIFEV